MKNKDLLEKECTCCLKIKQIDNFYWKNSNQCYESICKECRSDISKERIKAFKNPTRECISCKQEKPKRQFAYYSHNCRDCKLQTERQKELNKLNNSKKCNFCLEIKPLDDFYRSRDGHTPNCKKCTLERYPHKTQEWTREERNKRNLQSNIRRRDNPEKFLYNAAKSRAVKKNIEFNITIEDIHIPEFCPVLGIKLEFACERVSHYSPTLDRIDNSKGYTKGNVMVISWKANSIKNIGTAEEHEKIAKYMRDNIKTP